MVTDISGVGGGQVASEVTVHVQQAATLRQDGILEMAQKEVK